MLEGIFWCIQTFVTVGLRVQGSVRKDCQGIWMESISEGSDEMFSSQILLQLISNYFLSQTRIYGSVAFYPTVFYYVASWQEKQLKIKLLCN